MAGVVGEGYFSQNNVTANANWVAGTVGIGWDIGGQSGIVNVTSGLVGLAYNASPNTLSLLDAVDAEVENVGGTLPQAATYYARSPNFTSTVNNHYGFLMQDQTVGGGNNLTPHGFWELGAAPNQFAATTFTGAVTFNITGASAQCAQLSTVGVISGTGAPCSSLVIQTNGTNNATQSTLNLQPSTTNAVGLTVSPTYHSGGAEQFEITGGSYTGNAATATQLATTPINCGPGSAAIGITANGNATGCFAPGGLSGLTQYGMLYATSTTTGASAGPGLIGQTYVSDGTSGPPTLQGAGVVPRVVTSGGMDTILADNSTTLQDRGKVIVDCTGSTIVETVPDAGTSGMGGNFVFSIDVSDGSVSGTPCTASTLVTVNRTATSVFYVSNGLTANTAVNTFSLYPGQRALFNSDNTNWYVQINVPTSLTTNSGGTPTYLAAFSSGVNLVNATEHNVSLMRACNDTSGSATAQSCTPVNTTSGTLQANDELIYTTTTTNTGALTIAVSGGSALPVKKWSSGTLAALVANDIKAGEPVLLVYDGTNLIIPSAGNSGGSGGSPALSSVTALTSSTSISNGAFGWTLQNSLTGASSCELCVTESAASTGGTSGVQAGISVTTATGSTETPLYINQGILDATNPTVPAVNIVGDWSNSGIVGPLVAITVTNTSSTSGSCILSLTAGSLGTTLSHCLDTLGNVRAGGTYEGTVYNELTEFSGGLGSVSANSAAGGGLFKGSDNQNAGTAARGGGLYAIAGGLVTSSPNAAAMEGVLQLGEQGQKGAGTIAAAYDVLCSTSTAFVYNDCPTGATNIVGIAATATNPIGLVQGGQSPVNLDNTATNGDTVCTSATTAWDGHDNGTSACVYPQVQIGTVVSVAGSLTLYTSGQATTTQALSTSLPLVHLMWSTPTAPGVVATTKQKSETGADTGVLTYTTPSAAANYRVCLTESFSAASSATIGWTLTWTDSNGNAQTPTNEPLTQSGTAAPALTFTTSTAGNYAGCVNIDTNNAGANIVVKTTFSGTSMASKVSATIERMI